jgi:hypothetical protein
LFCREQASFLPDSFLSLASASKYPTAPSQFPPGPCRKQHYDTATFENIFVVLRWFRRTVQGVLQDYSQALVPMLQFIRVMNNTG